MIRFDVSTLLDARPGSSSSLSVDTGPWRLSDLEVGFLRGTVEVTRVESGLLLQGVIESQLRLDCVRCLEPFDLPVSLELEETFRLPGAAQRPDMPYAVASSGWLDLGPVLRELAWVAIPLKPLCRPTCKGLCPRCGADLNSGPCTCQDAEVDPRWAALKRLVT